MSAAFINGGCRDDEPRQAPLPWWYVEGGLSEARTLQAWTEDREVRDLPPAHRAGRRCWSPHPSGAVALTSLPFPLKMRPPKTAGLSSIAWMGMAKIADLYEGVPVTALAYPGTLDSPDSPKIIARQQVELSLQNRRRLPPPPRSKVPGTGAGQARIPNQTTPCLGLHRT